MNKTVHSEDGAEIHIGFYPNDCLIVEYFLSKNPGKGIKLLRKILGDVYPDKKVYAVLEPDAGEADVSSLYKLVTKVENVKECDIRNVVEIYKTGGVEFFHTKHAIGVSRIPK